MCGRHSGRRFQLGQAGGLAFLGCTGRLQLALGVLQSRPLRGCSPHGRQVSSAGGDRLELRDQVEQRLPSSGQGDPLVGPAPHQTLVLEHARQGSPGRPAFADHHLAQQAQRERFEPGL